MLGKQNIAIRIVWAGFLTLAAFLIIISFWVTHAFIHFKLKEIIANSKAIPASERKRSRFRLQSKLGMAMTITLLVGLGFPGLQYIGLPRTPPYFIPVNVVLLLFEITFATQYLIGVIAEIKKQTSATCWYSKDSDVDLQVQAQS